MSHRPASQQAYWDEEARSFDAIYSHEKGVVGNLIDAVFRWDIYERFQYTMKNARPIKGRSFLDVGCGTGRYALELALQGAVRVVGVDISGEMLEIAQRRAREQELEDRLTFEHTDLFAYEAEAQFDVCLGIGLFDYVAEPLPLMTRMRELVRDKAILSFPRSRTLRAVVRRARLGMKGCEVYFYSREEVERLLNAAGFDRSSIEKIGQLYCATAAAG